MSLSPSVVSRTVSHALRHEPWSYGLELDPNGWVAVPELVSALRELGAEWAGIDESEVLRAVESSVKRRHVVDGGRIRALYGHSLPKKIRYEPAEPPAQLYHATSPTASLRSCPSVACGLWLASTST